jgi:Cd2+/Zn2+-exporting ATPase
MEDEMIRLEKEAKTAMLIATEDKLLGIVAVADALKEDSVNAIKELHELGLQSAMITGDNQRTAEAIAKEVGIDHVVAEVLPDGKVDEIMKLQDRFGTIAMVGDGINDAPVLAVSDVGIAMGGLGSDVAIETADVVIQTDQLSKILTGIKIGKSTRNVVWQNIGLAFGVKAIVLILGAVGMATMWEAVFADVGVAFLAILNAIRLQKMKWD